MGFYLGIDAGTTGLKAVLFDETGREIAKGRAEYQILFTKRDMAELKAEEYWNACRKSISEVLAISKIDPTDIESLGISSQGETFIPIGKTGKPLRNAIVWLDNRSKEESKIIRGEIGRKEVYETTGQPEVIPTWPATKILWLRRNEPKIFKKVYKYLLVEDYLIHSLTGIAATEFSILSSTLLFNIKDERWWNEMLQIIGIDEAVLPKPMPSGTVVGYVTEKASRETGLNTRTIVSTGAFDHAAGALGGGNIAPGVVTETTGAAIALVATVDEPTYDPEYRIPCHCHAVRKKFFLLPWCQTAGMVLKWFRDEFGRAEIKEAKKSNIDAYDILTSEASKIEPGSDGLLVLPHFMGAGPPEFDSHARGVFFGLTLSHTKAHIVRAILESVALMLRKNIELIEELGITIKEIRSLGGGARSPLWNQIKADTVSKAILTTKSEEAASLGAAILSAVANGSFRSIEEACGAMVKLKYRYEPNPQNTRVYDKLLALYSSVYASLKPFFPLLDFTN